MNSQVTDIHTAVVLLLLACMYCYAADLCLQTRSFEDFPELRAGKIDILRDMDDLTGFPNSSVSAIYCSHTLEHSSMAGIHNTLRGMQWIDR